MAQTSPSPHIDRRVQGYIQSLRDAETMLHDLARQIENGIGTLHYDEFVQLDDKANGVASALARVRTAVDTHG